VAKNTARNNEGQNQYITTHNQRRKTMSNSQRKKLAAAEHNYLRDWEQAIKEDWYRHGSHRTIVMEDPSARSKNPVLNTSGHRPSVMLAIMLASQAVWTPPKL
jgi:hypothetical protein